MKRAALLTCTSVIACAQAPKTDPQQDVTTLVELTFPDGKAQLKAADYRMVFGADGTIIMPELLAIGTHGNVLGTDLCPLESKLGVAFYPGVTVIGGESVNGGTSSGEMELGGPYVARARLKYSIPYACPSTQHFVGESVFTFFPNGRIHRTDQVIQTSDSTIMPNSMCGCEGLAVPNSGYFVTSFYAYTNDAMMVDSMDRVAQGSVDSACAKWSDVTIGMRWLDSSATRISPNGAKSFVLDMMTSVSGNFPSVAATHSSVMKIVQGTPAPACGDVLALIAQPAVMVLDERIDATAEDGIYRDMHTHTGDITVRGTGATTPPFALTLKVGDHAKVRSSVEHAGFWYGTQTPADASGSTLFWFDQGLADGEVVTITPL